MSRKLATVAIATVVAVSFLFVGAGAVAAHDGGNDVGVSGNCDDANGNGGGGSVGANTDGDVDATNAEEIQSVVAGLTFFAQQKNEHPDREDTCDGGEDETSDDSNYDYIEAHAGDGNQQIQFCYSQDNANSSPPGGAGQGDQCHS